MYLIDLDENPYELVSCPDGRSLPACSNLYHNKSYKNVREKLEAIFAQARPKIPLVFRATSFVVATLVMRKKLI